MTQSLPISIVAICLRFLEAGLQIVNIKRARIYHIWILKYDVWVLGKNTHAYGYIRTQTLTYTHTHTFTGIGTYRGYIYRFKYTHHIRVHIQIHMGTRTCKFAQRDYNKGIQTQASTRNHIQKSNAHFKYAQYQIWMRMLGIVDA